IDVLIASAHIVEQHLFNKKDFQKVSAGISGRPPAKPDMGLEIFSLHNKVVSEMEGRMRDTNGRLYIGGLVMLVYLLIGAIVFMRLEYPLERIERETHWEYRDQWTERLTAAGIE
ncbi:hypothetical protein TELCIR_15098, partial [Teladorsagia circumcincta]